MIDIKDVSFNYEEHQNTLCDIDLHIKAGECILLCGESGCGKTTITKLINGLIPHFEEHGHLAGETFVNGYEVENTEMYELAKNIGSVFQNPKSQFFNVDSNNEIVFGLENAGVPPEEIHERLDVTVSNLKIQSLLNRNIFSMSGGEKQSLAFASVYAMNPPIFVLDEPTANLDAQAIMIIRDQMEQIKKEGHTIVISEHRLYFLTDIIDRAVFVKNGKIKRIFSKEEFRNLSDDERVEMGLRSLKYPILEYQTEALPIEKDTGLDVKNLTYSFDKTLVLDEVNFSAQEGQVLGIIGRNGIGKSTLTRCICGLLKQQSGEICLDGKPLNLKQRNKASFCVMQDVNHQLFSDSVWNECALSEKDISDQRIEEVLCAFNLLTYKDCHPMALSGGQKQRLAVATAVLSDKKILVFDEPTSGLDYSHMMSVSHMIRNLCKDDKIILIISHDLEFLNQTCDTIFNMNKGVLESRS